MIGIRLIGIGFAFLLAFILSKFTQVELINVMTVMAFILTIDLVCVNFIVRLYLMGIKDKKKDGPEL